MIDSSNRESIGLTDAVLERALVLGGGASGLIVAHALRDVGVRVTLVQIPGPPSQLVSPGAKLDATEYLPTLAAANDDIEILSVETPPEISRNERRFAARFGDGSSRLFGSLVVTSGIELRQGTRGPDELEILSARFPRNGPQRIAWLLDHASPTHPALGMNAIRLSLENVEAGGESYVLFRHIPVAHVFGESLYDAARRAGVRFLRYGAEEPELSRMARPQETPIWRITGRDVIEQGEAFTFECERVVSVTGPDPSSIPGWLSGLLEGDLDREGFLLSDSVHGLAGRSFRSGVFAVGEVTGNLDLLRVIVQARAVAGQVRSWMLRSDRAAHDVSVSVAESCIRCLTCYRLCPHAAISFAAGAAHSRMQIWPGSCEECGICVSECPRCSLDLVGYPDEGWREVLSEVAGSPRSDLVVMFACKRSAARLAQQGNIPATARVITVPCAGRVSEAMIWAALAGGARGIVVAGCHPGNCASETGDQWARSRVAQVNEALVALVGPKPLPAVIYLPVAANEPARFARMLEEYCSRVSYAEAHWN